MTSPSQTLHTDLANALRSYEEAIAAHGGSSIDVISLSMHELTYFLATFIAAVSGARPPTQQAACAQEGITAATDELSLLVSLCLPTLSEPLS